MTDKPLTKKQKLVLIAQKKKELLEIQAMEAKLKKEKESNAKKLRGYESANKLLYFNNPDKGYLGKHGKWEYNPIQKKYFGALKDPRKNKFCLVGANRISKTFSSTGCTAPTVLRGHFPWEDVEVVGNWMWEARGWEPPIKIRIVGQDWEKHVKSVLISTIKELWPASWNLEVRKNNVGVEAYYKDAYSGSTIEIMSNKSEADLFEGWSGHCVIYDEPPKQDVRIACARGLIDFNGIEVFAMTLLKEPWVETEIIDAVNEDGTPDQSVFSVVGEIGCNVGFGITQKGVDNFAKTLTEEQKLIRLKGISAYKSGLILDIDKNEHRIPRFDIPSNWMVDVAIDIGVAKPHDILYMATATDNRKYLFLEENLKGDGEAIGDSIIKKVNRYNLRVNRVICDPLAKADQNNENSTWEKIERSLGRHDMFLEAGSKDKDDGIIAMNNLFKTVNNMAALFIFQDLPITCRQLYGWTYDKEGKPSKRDDDMCENAYRLMLLGTEYEEPYVEEYETYRPNNGKDMITGY